MEEEAPLVSWVTVSEPEGQPSRAAAVQFRAGPSTHGTTHLPNPLPHPSSNSPGRGISSCSSFPPMSPPAVTVAVSNMSQPYATQRNTRLRGAALKMEFEVSCLLPASISRRPAFIKVYRKMGSMQIRRKTTPSHHFLRRLLESWLQIVQMGAWACKIRSEETQGSCDMHLKSGLVKWGEARHTWPPITRFVVHQPCKDTQSCALQRIPQFRLLVQSFLPSSKLVRKGTSERKSAGGTPGRRTGS